MSAPQVPPRPTRAHHQHQAPASLNEMPRIPPRPSHRMAGRSRSPSRDHFPISPLNEIPFAMNLGNKSGSLYSNASQNESESNLGVPQRPPSVSLPSIGQEGNEYADIEYGQSRNETIDADISQNEPTQTRNVGSDLPLHAPRPSISSSTAKARVSTVTRTDSTQAAAAGIGKAETPRLSDEKGVQGSTPLHPKMGSSRTGSSASTERPASTQASDSDHGIPEIGQRVPMYPDAGDVQAPSPSPFMPPFPSGIGFHNDGTQKPGRHHGRTRSGREIFRGPPGSYGLHGHGVPHNDQFEKAWYEKHPDALLREEHGQYGPGISGSRGEWALSSEDLNKIVRDTASRGSGLGTSPQVGGLPNEQIGYMASEEYTSRIHTPISGTYHSKAHSNHSQTHVESPLRKASFPVDVESKDAFQKSKEPHLSTRSQSEYALESETEDDEAHIKALAARSSKYTGNGYDPSTEDLASHGGYTDGEGGWMEESRYGVPILASDEVAKEPGSEYLQPAVSPVQERRGSNYYSGVDSDAPPSYQSGHRNRSRSGSAPNSRPSSRPVSIHGSLPALSRFTTHDEREDMHTPLEDVDEYEPLFPEEEDKEGRPMPTTDKFKRREIMNRRFPSQDIWEDTPNSLQLQATVETPEPAEDQVAPAPRATSTVFETPETEAARKGEVDEQEKAKLIPKDERLAKSRFKPYLQGESQRPGLKQRFPSRDIWEDSPDSACLEATVGELPDEEIKSPVDEGLRAGAGVDSFGRPGEAKAPLEQARDVATAGARAVEKPTIPPRPVKSKGSGELPGPGSQHLPSIPARPPRRLPQAPSLTGPAADSSPLESKQVSPSESRKAPTLPDKPKPQVPARPARSNVGPDSSEMATVTKTTSASSSGGGDAGDDKREDTFQPPAPKTKPLLPSRPVGNKIASLKAGFLSDLDKRLQVGPQGPKPQEKALAKNEPPEEKAPLADARKGRARGPARRKPAAPSAPIAEGLEPPEAVAKVKWSVQEPWTVWQTKDDGTLSVGQATSTAPVEPVTKHGSSITTPTSAPLSTEPVKSEQPIASDASVSKSESPSAADPLAVGDPTATEHGRNATLSKEGTSKESSVDEFTPSSSPSPTIQPMADEATQTGEKAITVNPGTTGEEKMTVYLGGEAQGNQNPILRE
ncbi:hypothetical protein MMC07_003237 [Pseudocyphellaria aurata]|nr:hypothetical protein [Pseudocyphellaria aurata]